MSATDNFVASDLNSIMTWPCLTVESEVGYDHSVKVFDIVQDAHDKMS